MPRNLSRRALVLAFAVAVAALPAAAQDLLRAFAAQTTVHELANGWTFILVRRPVAPVASFVTLADVGSAQEVPGITGLAHMFEHMAFKGSVHVGTRDYPAEQKALDALETAYQAYQAERLSPRPDPGRLERLRGEFKRRQGEAARFVVKNEFDDILSREGSVGLNAQTNNDRTEYYSSLPANKVELWAFLESERFAHPVFREFYEERDVVQEERRMSTDSQPMGRLIEQFTAAAFVAHPYHHSAIGHMSDLQSISITDAEAFFRAHYGPGNLVTAIVGDIHPEMLVPLLETYFGRIPARPAPPPLRTVEPPQIAEKTVILADPSQPVYMEAYHKPAHAHPDQEVYDAIDDVLSNGRTSRLYRTLVRDKKLAVQVESFTGLPGDKYPNLWTVIVTPAFGAGNEQVQAVVHAELERLQREDVGDEELTRFRTRAKASLLRALRDNQGIATQLVEYTQLYGDWRELFRSLERVDKVTKADIRRVANQIFQPANRTVGMIVTRGEAKGEAPAAAARPGQDR
jgi:predicted Zn-dependent peptidase